jgi:hypothetical protein
MDARRGRARPELYAPRPPPAAQPRLVVPGVSRAIHLYGVRERQELLKPAPRGLRDSSLTHPRDSVSELVHGAHADEDELPPDSELLPALEAVEASFRWVFP